LLEAAQPPLHRPDAPQTLSQKTAQRQSLRNPLSVKETPTIDDTIARMCNFAGDYTTKNKSPNQLYEESGYVAVQADVTIERLRQYVASHPDLIADWLCYCNDPRTDMWVMKKEASG
jgi:hypothetical protein